MMDRAAALRKLRACLQLAASSNPNEAANALRQAQALMRQYGLDADEADPDAITQCDGKTRSRGGDIPNRIWMLASVCARLFGCYVFVYQHQAEAKTVVRFVGRGSAPELAGFAYTVLRRQLDADTTRHIARCRKRKSRLERGEAFGMAWIDGLCLQLELPDLPALDAAAFKHFVEQGLGALETTRLRKAKGTNHDRVAGFLAGRQAKLHRGVYGSSRLEIGYET